MSPSNLNAQTTHSFLKGSVPNSIFVDITTVKDKKIFLTELTTFCQGLPHQYGRRDEGLAQLHSDMQRNLSSFGHIIDSGTIRGTSGIYSVKSYVVLEKFPEPNQQRDEAPRPELQHNVHWVYQPLAYSTSATSASLLDDVFINDHATWSSTKPYCRYCHGDYPLKDCQFRQQATICYWCNESGHIAKYCDRKNVYGVSGSPNKKPRKTPIVSATEKPPISTPDSVTSLDKDFVVSDEVNIETTSPLDVIPITVQEASGIPTILKQPGSEKSKYARFLRSATNKMLISEDSTYTNNGTVPVVPAVKVCPHCKKEGHVRKQHRNCEFYVPHQTKISGKPLPSNEDTEMMECPDPSVHTTSNDLANKNDMSIDAQGGIASEHLVAPHSAEALCSTSNEMLDAAVQFYSKLYSPELIDNPAIDDLLSAIPDSLRLSDLNQRFLTNSFITMI
ncbi:hypothetical protein G6F37_008179 [Rhizopus arrhizus]|nr:hypothetical protein G6F38_008790 [Rhizopus arrhizus]KAG1155824.1 hypothetical protein G6F37_008179 [Rhizopus arrhizus]